MTAVHMRRDPGSSWAFCRALRGVLVTDNWSAVTCGHCLGYRHQLSPGDYSQRNRAYSRAIKELREQHREEFDALYQSALESERWKNGELDATSSTK